MTSCDGLLSPFTNVAATSKTGTANTIPVIATHLTQVVFRQGAIAANDGDVYASLRLSGRAASRLQSLGRWFILLLAALAGFREFRS